MTRIPNLTLPLLLDHVEGLLGRTAVGRTSVQPRAYAADAAGRVTVIAFSRPADAAGWEALRAILQSEMLKRQAAMCVVALEAAVAVGGMGESQECLVLEGQYLRSGETPELRVLAVERQGRKIAHFCPLAVERFGADVGRVSARH